MKNTISQKYIENHLLDTYGYIKHDIKKLAIASRLTGKKYNIKYKKVFHHVLNENSGITNAKSYGFDTRYGRAIKESFSNFYYSIESQCN